MESFKLSICNVTYVELTTEKDKKDNCSKDLEPNCHISALDNSDELRADEPTAILSLKSFKTVQKS